jgi:hypothetical protein
VKGYFSILAIIDNSFPFDIVNEFQYIFETQDKRDHSFAWECCWSVCKSIVMLSADWMNDLFQLSRIANSLRRSSPQKRDTAVASTLIKTSLVLFSALSSLWSISIFACTSSTNFSTEQLSTIFNYSFLRFNLHWPDSFVDLYTLSFSAHTELTINHCSELPSTNGLGISNIVHKTESRLIRVHSEFVEIGIVMVVF